VEANEYFPFKTFNYDYHYHYYYFVLELFVNTAKSLG
jgi:hypothetical protein